MILNFVRSRPNLLLGGDEGTSAILIAFTFRPHSEKSNCRLAIRQYGYLG